MFFVPLDRKMKMELSAMISIGAKSERNDGFCETESAKIGYSRQRASEIGSTCRGIRRMFALQVITQSRKT
jgi:hypothetical protein